LLAGIGSQIADARRDRDAWRDQAQRLAIANRRKREARLPWWGRLAGSERGGGRQLSDQPGLVVHSTFG
jgi:hypothetical protein